MTRSDPPFSTQASAPVSKPPVAKEAIKPVPANPPVNAVRQEGLALGVVLGLGALQLPSFKVPVILWINAQALKYEITLAILQFGVFH